MFWNSTAKPVQVPVAGLLCLSIAFAPAWAQTPDLRLSDLVNQGSDHAQREISNRGFVFIHADQRGVKLWQYWWNANTRQCIQGVVSDGRIQSLNPIVEGNCT